MSVYIVAEKPDVAPITETWASSSHLISKLSFLGYERFNNNRTLPSIRIDKHDAERYDTVFLEITTCNNKKLTPATVYTDHLNNNLPMTLHYAMMRFTHYYKVKMLK